MIVFIAGTGTDVGKTVISAAILQGLGKLGKKAAYLKAVQTGERDADRQGVVRWLGNQDGYQVHPTLYQFPDPMSPDQAARRQELEEGKTTKVRVEELVDQVQRLHLQSEILLVEAAGGLMVPLNDRGENWLDFLCRLDRHHLKVVLVGSSQLGTLNHSFLSLFALQSRGIVPSALVLNGPSHSDNEWSIGRDYPNLPVLAFPTVHESDRNAWWEHSLSLATRLLAAWHQQSMEEGLRRESMMATDQKHVWHPFTQHKGSRDPLAVVGARGIYLELADGRRVIDGISSWWVNTIGHGRKEIADALARQQQKLDHVLFAGTTHESATLLAKTLLSMAGAPFQRVFFSDNGSTAVEVALKMAFQVFQQRGENQRDRYLALRGSYHGDTVGAMSLGAATGFHDPYRHLFFPCEFITPLTSHVSAYCPGGESDGALRMAELEAMFASHGHRICAVVVEPLLQGAGGMLVQNRQWLQRLTELARHYGALIIFDEVFTGLGRLGAPFAFNIAGVVPDLLCTAKGLTGGNLPLAVTLASEEIFRHFWDDAKDKAFLHGHSYTANPLACAAANAALALVEKENLMDRAQRMEVTYRSWLSTSAGNLGLENGRALGGILAFELPGSGQGSYFKGQGQKIAEEALRAGLLIRPLGNTVYLAPPLVSSEEQLQEMLGILADVLGN